VAPYSVHKVKNVANVSTNRILKLTALEGGGMMLNNASIGKRSTFNVNLFTGDKLIHAIQDNGLWHLEYRTSTGQSAGNLPGPLQQKWTNFNQLRKFLDAYFLARNVKIDEVIS
jgi:hypothetical protein